MTAHAPFLDIDAAQDLIFRTEGYDNTKFSNAFAEEIERSGGTVIPCDTLMANTLYPMAYTVSLHGITAHGADEERAIRSWRTVARHMIDPHSALTLNDAQLLAWSIEALTTPEILIDDALTARACKTILRLERRCHALRQRAIDLLRTIDAHPLTPAAATPA